MADVFVVPGRMFGPAGGMLMYAAAVAEARGATVHRHSWGGEGPMPFDSSVEEWVRDDITAELDEIGGTPLLIGKSLGTNAAAVAADRGLPAVWLTPLLTAPWVVAALERATAPFLLAGGTADPAWDSATAARLTPYVFEAERADHGLFVPGPVAGPIDVAASIEAASMEVAASIDVLKGLVTAIGDFLDAIGWRA